MHHRVKVTRNLLTKLTSWWQSWVERLPLPFTWNSLSEITMQIYSFSKTQRYLHSVFFYKWTQELLCTLWTSPECQCIGPQYFYFILKYESELQTLIYIRRQCFSSSCFVQAAVLSKQLFCPSSNSKCILKNVYSAVKKYGLHWFCDQMLFQLLK